MKFALITDVHYGVDRFFRGAHRGLASFGDETLNEFVKTMNNDIHPQFVIQLGDVIQEIDHDTDIKNLKKVLNILSSLNYPYYSVIGNHENIFISEEELVKLIRTQALYYSFDIKEYHCLVLYCKSTKELYIDEVQKSWLIEELKNTNKKILIFAHYSLADQDLTGNYYFEGRPEMCLIDNRKEIREMLEKSEKVVAVFNGHLHWNNMTIHNNIPYFTFEPPLENKNNNGVPSKSYAVIEINKKYITVDILGSDPQVYNYKHKKTPSFR